MSFTVQLMLLALLFVSQVNCGPMQSSDTKLPTTTDLCSCPARSTMVLGRCYCEFGTAWIDGGCKDKHCRSDQECVDYFPNSKCDRSGKQDKSKCVCSAGFVLDPDRLNCVDSKKSDKAPGSSSQTRRESRQDCEQRVAAIRSSANRGGGGLKLGLKKYMPLLCVVLFFGCFILGLAIYGRIRGNRWRERVPLPDADQFGPSENSSSSNSSSSTAPQ